MKNIAVFFGGESIEHEISCITGVLTVNCIDKTKFNPIPIFISHDGSWWTGEELRDIDFYKSVNYSKIKRVSIVAGSNLLYLNKGKKQKPVCEIACAINCLHGERGEDGSLYGFLNLCKIPLVGAPLFASSLSMNKSQTKLVLKGLGVKSLPFVNVKNKNDYRMVEKTLEFPVIVKPDTGGSSIGISVAENAFELERAILSALRYSNGAIVEPKLKDFTEINCACYSAKGEFCVSECEKPISHSDILSFNEKYKNGEREFPAKIDKKISSKIKQITAKIYRALGFSGIIRVDFMVANNEVYVNEINCVPGSLSYYLFVRTLKEWSVILTDLINQSLEDYARQTTLTKKFDSGILTLTGSKGAKRLKNKN